MNSIEQDELTLKQRIGGREQRFIIYEINGDLMPENIGDQTEIMDLTEYEPAEMPANNIVQFPATETPVDDDREDEVFTAYPVM